MKKPKTLLTKVDIDWLISSMRFVFPTKQESTKKFDQVMKKLDKFVGEIETKRQEQTLHQGQHEQITERIERVEKKLNISAPLN